MNSRRPSAVGAAVAVLVSALYVVAMGSQYSRRLPQFFEYKKGLLSADSLIYTDFVLQFASGKAEMADWIANPAQYWVSWLFPLMALDALTDGHWRLSLALRGSLELIVLVLSLAALLKIASGKPLSKSVQFSAASIAGLSVVDYHFGGALTMTFAVPGHRTLNIALFLLSCAGAAKVAASGRVNQPATWLYLMLCFVSGAEDALLSVHVVLPVFLASLWWGWTKGGKGMQAWGVAAAAALGVALNFAGLALNRAFMPFTENKWRFDNINVTDGLDAAMPLFAEGRFSKASIEFVNSLAFQFTANFNAVYLGANILNFLFLLCSVLVLAWSLAPSDRNGAEAGNTVEACALAWLRAMYWSLALATLAAMIVVKSRVEYSHAFLLAGPLALAVAWFAGTGNRPWIRNTATGLAALCLAAYLAFFRPELVTTGPAECAAEDGVLQGTGLGRGMVTFWHAREALVMSGTETMHVTYIAEKYAAEESPLGQVSYARPLRHVGNIAHTLGSADYVSVDLKFNALGVVGFREQFGLPSRIEYCGIEAFYLYEVDWLSTEDLERLPHLYL